MTESLALETCGPIFELEDFVGWDQKEFEMERRRISKSVRHISGESVVVGSNHLIVVDDLSSWLENGAPPSPRRIVSELTEVGHLAAVSSYGRPSFRTNAPWEAIVEAAELIQPPM